VKFGRKLSEEDREEILRLWLEMKLSYRRIGSLFGVSGERVRQVILEELRKRRLIGTLSRRLRGVRGSLKI